MRWVQVGLTVLLLGSVFASVPASAEAFSTAADFALLEDYETGAVLVEKNADEPMPPTAMVKLLTAEIVFQQLQTGKLSLDSEFEVSEKAWREGGAPARGAAMFLSVKSRVRVEDLLRGLIIQSGNDAAMTLAEGLAGTEDNFATLMNRRAAEIGMVHSHFTNARGKADPDNQTTARDLAILAAYVIRTYPDYLHYFSEKEFTWNRIRQLNRNPAIGMDVGADGLKAGDVADGGYAILATAVQGEQRLILVLNGMKTANERLDETRKLFDYGFHSFDRRTLFEAGAAVGTAAVYGGLVGGVPLVSNAPIVLFLPRGENDKVVAKLVYTGPLVAPVAADRETGRLKLWRGDMLVVDAPLKTGGQVPLGGLARRALDAALELAGDAVRRALKKL